MALDFFAGDGGLLSHRILSGYDVEAWDNRVDALSSYVFPDAVKRCGDSFKLAQETENRYDHILIDNPAGCFGEGYCEHFEALDCALPLLRDESTITFNVITSPTKYLLAQPLHGGSIRNTARRIIGDLTEWNQRRRAYYGPDFVWLEDYLNIYLSHFKAKGFRVKALRREKRLPGVWLISFDLQRGGASKGWSCVR